MRWLNWKWIKRYVIQTLFGTAVEEAVEHLSAIHEVLEREGLAHLAQWIEKIIERLENLI